MKLFQCDADLLGSPDFEHKECLDSIRNMMACDLEGGSDVINICGGMCLLEEGDDLRQAKAPGGVIDMLDPAQLQLEFVETMDDGGSTVFAAFQKPHDDGTEGTTFFVPDEEWLDLQLRQRLMASTMSSDSETLLSAEVEEETWEE